MKTLFVSIFILTCSFHLQAQSSPSADSLFIVTYTTGPSWKSDKGPGDQTYFKEHSANLSAWRKEGFIRFGARYSDKGIIFVAARSGAIVRERVLNDPAVVNGLFRVSIEKLNPFYYGCIEKP